MLQSQSIPSDIKNYCVFCTIFSLKQLIKVPTLVTCIFMITKLYNALGIFQESKEVCRSKLDTVC